MSYSLASLNDYSNDFATMISAIGSNPATVVVSGTTSVSSGNPSVPANICVVAAPGAHIDIADGQTLTILNFRADTKGQLFDCSGSGKVVFGPAVTEVCANWFCSGGSGASGSPWTSSDGTAGIAKAIESVNYGGSKIKLLPGYYETTTQITVQGNVTIEGSSYYTGTIIDFKGNSGACFLIGDASNVRPQGSVLSDLRIQVYYANCIGVKLLAARNVSVTRVFVQLDPTLANYSGQSAFWLAGEDTGASIKGVLYCNFTDCVAMAATGLADSVLWKLTGAWSGTTANGGVNACNFFNCRAYGGVKSLVVGPSLANHWFGFCCEKNSGTQIEFQEGAMDNAIYGIYAEGQSSYTTAPPVVCSSSTYCTRNRIYDHLLGAYMSMAYSTMTQDNRVMQGSDMYASSVSTYPVLRGKADGSVAAGTGSASPVAILGPGGNMKENAITYASSVTPDLANGSHVRISSITSAGITINDPINVVGEPLLLIELKRDNTGSATISYGSSFKTIGNTGLAANARRLVLFHYQATIGKWQQIAPIMDHST